jgi:hypothetical protein
MNETAKLLNSLSNGKKLLMSANQQQHLDSSSLTSTGSATQSTSDESTASISSSGSPVPSLSHSSPSPSPTHFQAPASVAPLDLSQKSSRVRPQQNTDTKKQQMNNSVNNKKAMLLNGSNQVSPDETEYYMNQIQQEMKKSKQPLINNKSMNSGSFVAPGLGSPTMTQNPNALLTAVAALAAAASAQNAPVNMNKNMNGMNANPSTLNNFSHLKDNINLIQQATQSLFKFPNGNNTNNAALYANYLNSAQANIDKGKTSPFSPLCNANEFQQQKNSLKNQQQQQSVFFNGPNQQSANIADLLLSMQQQMRVPPQHPSSSSSPSSMNEMPFFFGNNGQINQNNRQIPSRLNISQAGSGASSNSSSPLFSGNDIQQQLGINALLGMLQNKSGQSVPDNSNKDALLLNALLMQVATAAANNGNNNKPVASQMPYNHLNNSQSLSSSSSSTSSSTASSSVSPTFPPLSQNDPNSLINSFIQQQQQQMAANNFNGVNNELLNNIGKLANKKPSKKDLTAAMNLSSVAENAKNEDSAASLYTSYNESDELKQASASKRFKSEPPAEPRDESDEAEEKPCAIPKVPLKTRGRKSNSSKLDALQMTGDVAEPKKAAKSDKMTEEEELVSETTDEEEKQRSAAVVLINKKLVQPEVRDLQMTGNMSFLTSLQQNCAFF